MTREEIIQALTALQVQITVLIKAMEEPRATVVVPREPGSALAEHIIKVETMGQPDDGIIITAS